jgi:hypothetical protein
MGRAAVTRTLETSAGDLWRLVRDFGDVRWIPGGGSAKVEGSGPGMTRTFQGPDRTILERLESVDEKNRTITYTIPQGVPFPVTGYRATMRVTDDGGGARLDWSCEFTPQGVPEAQARQAIEGMYGVMIGWIQDCLRAESAAAGAGRA